MANQIWINKLKNEYKNKKIKALYNWLYKFMKRNGLSFKIITHIGQFFPDKANLYINQFLKHIIRKRNAIVPPQ